MARMLYLDQYSFEIDLDNVHVATDVYVENEKFGIYIPFKEIPTINISNSNGIRITTGYKPLDISHIVSSNNIEVIYEVNHQFKLLSA